MKTAPILTLLALMLLGCSDSPDSRICGSLAMRFPAGMMVKTSDDQLQVAMSCVERWAARLARSPDSADAVARAAVAACENAISYLVELTTKDAIASPTYNEMDWWRRHALFIAIQTRAGHCYPDA